MTRFHVLVGEDEPLARAMVANLLKRDAEVATVVECADARGVHETLARQRFDIAFLDIEMPEATGIEIAGQLAHDGPVVVFVTAFSRYAPSAFDVHAVDYVLKPFTDERFFAALERAKQRVREHRLGELASQLATVSAELKHAEEPAGTGYLNRMASKEGERSILVNTSEVVWIEAEDYYVLVHSKRGRHLLRATLASLADRLDPEIFLRVHRAAIVNAEEIREVRDEGGLVLLLSNGSRVSVSRSRRRHVEPLLLPRFRMSKPHFLT
jgi:two-component system LytT family response regulator